VRSVCLMSNPIPIVANPQNGQICPICCEWNVVGHWGTFYHSHGIKHRYPPPVTAYQRESSMLAEIFMLHLEAKLRVLDETPPSRSPRFVPFDMSHGRREARRPLQDQEQDAGGEAAAR